MKGFKIRNAAELKKWLKTSGDYDWGRAVAQAAKLGEPVIPVLIEGLSGAGYGATGVCEDALARIGKPAVPALIAVFESGDYFVRVGAARALGKMRERSAVPLFSKRIMNAIEMEMCKEKKESIKEMRYLIRALGEMKGDEAVELLVRVIERASLKMHMDGWEGSLSENYSEMREDAADALKEIGHSAVPGLVRALNCCGKDARIEIARILREKGKLAVGELNRVILDKGEGMVFRLRAVAALSREEQKRHIPFILGNLQDVHLCEELCEQLRDMEPRNAGDLRLLQKAATEFRRKHSGEIEKGEHRGELQLLAGLYLEWSRKLNKKTERLVADKKFHVPKVENPDKVERVMRMRRVNP